MRISAVVGVKDEVGLIGPAVAALLRAGVTSVSILDDASTDGTGARIARLCADPRVFAVPPQEDQDSLLDFDGPLFGPVLARDRSDWLLFCDADEMLLPRSGSLLETAGLADHDVIEIPRYNVAAEPGLDPAGLCDPAVLRGLDLIVRRERLDRVRMAAEPDLRWITTDLPPKLLIRPDRVGGFTVGGHRVLDRPDRPLRRLRAADLLIAHLPFTTWDRFARKMENIAAAVGDRPLPPDTERKAWHWWRWVGIARDGGLRAEYDRQILDPATRTAWRHAGTLATAADILDAGHPAPAMPAPARGTG